MLYFRFQKHIISYEMIMKFSTHKTYEEKTWSLLRETIF